MQTFHPTRVVRARRPTATAKAVQAGPATATTCVLTPELTEGPYYVDDALIRPDISDGKAGVPLKLQIAVQEVAGCSPLANATIEIWHCDARGYYSGVSANNPGPDADPALVAEAAEQMCPHGVQITDAGRPDAQRTTNDQDRILADHEDEPGFLVAVTQLVEDSLAEGLLGTITIGVDPTATPSATGGGPGGPGGGTPPGSGGD
jgi:hypothetical protein